MTLPKSQPPALTCQVQLQTFFSVCFSPSLPGGLRPPSPQRSREGTPHLLAYPPALMVANWTRLRLRVLAHSPSAAWLPTESCRRLSPDVLSPPPSSPPSHTLCYPGAIPVPPPPANSSLRPLHAWLSRIILLLRNLTALHGPSEKNSYLNILRAPPQPPLLASVPTCPHPTCPSEPCANSFTFMILLMMSLMCQLSLF